MKTLGCVCVLRSWRSLPLLAAILAAAAVRSAWAVPPEKLASCCKTASRQPISEPITGFMVQPASGACVQAVIFQTATGLFCSQLNAPWVHRKIMAFRRAKAQATKAAMTPSTAASLLSIITSSSSFTSSSSSSPPPSSSTLSSFSPTSFPSASSTPFSSFSILSSSSIASTSSSSPSTSSSSPSPSSSSSPARTSGRSEEETASRRSSDGSATVME